MTFKKDNFVSVQKTNGFKIKTENIESGYKKPTLCVNKVAIRGNDKTQNLI